MLRIDVLVFLPKAGIQSGDFISVLIDIAAVRTTEEVPAINIISVPVMIIILGISRNFVRIYPHDIFKIFMSRIQTSIDDCYNNFIFRISDEVLLIYGRDVRTIGRVCTMEHPFLVLSY